MKKNLILIFSLCAFALTGCNTPDKVTSIPKAATIEGESNNRVSREAGVLLTAVAEGASTYIWYGANGKIDGATSETYLATQSGTYYAAGVNGVGTGEISSAKQVIVYSFDFTDLTDELEGDYTALGTSQGLMMPELEPGVPTWESKLIYAPGDPDVDVFPFYVATNWANKNGSAEAETPAGVLIDIHTDSLTIDSQTSICSSTETIQGQTVFSQGFFVPMYIGPNGLAYTNDPAQEIFWDAKNGVLDFSATYNGYDVVLVILAVNVQTGEPFGTYCDGYANVKLTRNLASGTASFSGDMVQLSDERNSGFGFRPFKKGLEIEGVFPYDLK